MKKSMKTHMASKSGDGGENNVNVEEHMNHPLKDDVHSYADDSKMLCLVLAQQQMDQRRKR
jgi:hypothetical protein